jgi:hypothetical protein
MTEIQLAQVAGEDARVLIGHDRGLAARQLFDLDRLDGVGDKIVVTAPVHLRTLTPSFVQGLFAASIHSLGEDAFFDHYTFQLSDGLFDDIRAGVDRVLTSRHISGR